MENGLNMNHEILSYEIAKRHYDGKFVLWREVEIMSEKEGYSRYWEALKVFTLESDAKNSLPILPT